MRKRSTEKMRLTCRTGILPVFLLLIAGVFTGLIKDSSAYLLDHREKTNSLGIGINEIQIREEFPPHAPVPGTDTFLKKVQICNSGTIPCYIRAYLAVSDAETEKAASFSADGRTFVPAAQYGSAPPAGWTYDPGDGYYYCTAEIGPGELTPVLLQSVRTVTESGKTVQPYDIYVYAESIQCRDKNGRLFEGDNRWKKAWNEFTGKKSS